MNSISDLQLIELPRFSGDNGELFVVEADSHLPMSIARVFVVRAGEGAIRGQHAHRLCSQVLFCVHGAIRVSCDDGSSQRDIELGSPEHAILVPPSIWGEQTFLTRDSVLVVLCDRKFEEKDYIRNRIEFDRYRLGE
ncbi:MAG: hypothetical protein BMS9Abin05_2265 [Rhodothermia bacterium]|nr:MAG: hypothetical protein BMS9Abin05_2265 [Rhodothermia bacterium]